MKIKCELQGRDGKVVTSTEIESPGFGIGSDNPFPASRFFSAVVFDSHAAVTYRVEDARGEA